MKYKILNIEAANPEYDPYTFEPFLESFPEEWEINLTFTIGLNNSEADNFQLLVCSPLAIRPPQWGNAYVLFLKNWDINNVIRLVNIKIEECSEDTWKKTADKLSTYMKKWEFQQ